MDELKAQDVQAITQATEALKSVAVELRVEVDRLKRSEAAEGLPTMSHRALMAMRSSGVRSGILRLDRRILIELCTRLENFKTVADTLRWLKEQPGGESINYKTLSRFDAHFRWQLDAEFRRAVPPDPKASRDLSERVRITLDRLAQDSPTLLADAKIKPHLDELGRRLVLDRTAAALDDAQAWLNGRLDEPVDRRSFR